MKKCNLTKKINIPLKKHVGNVDCDFSMEEYYLKYIL